MPSKNAMNLFAISKPKKKKKITKTTSLDFVKTKTKKTTIKLEKPYKNSIIEALKYLTSLDGDYAKKINYAGSSKAHSSLFHGSIRYYYKYGYLTPVMEYDLWQKLRYYKNTQLPRAGIDYDSIPHPPFPDKLKKKMEQKFSERDYLDKKDIDQLIWDKGTVTYKIRNTNWIAKKMEVPFGFKQYLKNHPEERKKYKIKDNILYKLLKEEWRDERDKLDNLNWKPHSPIAIHSQLYNVSVAEIPSWLDDQNENSGIFYRKFIIKNGKIYKMGKKFEITLDFLLNQWEWTDPVNNKGELEKYAYQPPNWFEFYELNKDKLKKAKIYSTRDHTLETHWALVRKIKSAMEDINSENDLPRYFKSLEWTEPHATRFGNTRYAKQPPIWWDIRKKYATQIKSLGIYSVKPMYSPFRDNLYCISVLDKIYKQWDTSSISDIKKDKEYDYTSFVNKKPEIQIDKAKLNAFLNANTKTSTKKGLYLYQVPHVKRMIEILAKYKIVFDTSGTGCGKTFCNLMACKFLNKRPLIITPNNVLSSWYNDIKNLSESDYIGIVNYESIKSGNLKIYDFKKDRWVIKYLSKLPDGHKDKIIKVSPNPASKLNKYAPKKVITWNLPEDAVLIFDEGHRMKNKSINRSLLLSSFEQNIQTHILTATLAESPMHMYGFGLLCRFYNTLTFTKWLEAHGTKKNEWGGYVFDGNVQHMYKIHKDMKPFTSGINKKQLIKEGKFPDSLIEMEEYQYPPKITKILQDLFGDYHTLGGDSKISLKQKYRKILGNKHELFTKLKKYKEDKEFAEKVNKYILQKTKLITLEERKAEKEFFSGLLKSISNDDLLELASYRINKLGLLNVPPIILKILEELEEKLLRYEIKAQTGSEKVHLPIRQKKHQKAEILKVPYFVTRAKDYIKRGRSVAIFTNYDYTIQALSKLLKTNCIISGNIKEQDKRKNMSDFRTNKKKIIICNVSASREGISLHLHHEEAKIKMSDKFEHANMRTALICPNDSAQYIQQVLGRVHRAGGTYSEQYLICAKDTIEVQIYHNVQSKIRQIEVLNQGFFNA